MANEDVEMEIWEHLEELIYRLRRALISWIIATMFVAVAPDSLLDMPPKLNISMSGNYRTIVQAVIEYVRERTAPTGVQLIAGTWTGAFSLYFNAAALIGFILALPVITYEIYAYVKPALYPEERGAAIKFALSFLVLFMIGVSIAFFVVIPATLRILTYFIGAIGATPVFYADEFYNFIFMSTIIIGLVFTFPCEVYILVKIGLIDHTDLADNRKNFIAGVFIATAILTPDPTPFSMLILSIPLIILYEISIIVAKRVEYEI